MTAPARPAQARRRRGARSGATAVEFALTSSALLMLCFGVMNLGLLLWTQEAIEAAAAATARCSALGASTCSNAQQYADSVAAAEAFTGVITTANVWVQANATCASTQGNVTAGKNTVVIITSSFWSSGLLSYPLGGKALGATACYPSTP